MRDWAEGEHRGIWVLNHLSLLVFRAYASSPKGGQKNMKLLTISCRFLGTAETTKAYRAFHSNVGGFLPSRTLLTVPSEAAIFIIDFIAAPESPPLALSKAVRTKFKNDVGAFKTASNEFLPSSLSAAAISYSDCRGHLNYAPHCLGCQMRCELYLRFIHLCECVVCNRGKTKLPTLVLSTGDG